jgi:hypothetical protein
VNWKEFGRKRSRPIRGIVPEISLRSWGNPWNREDIQLPGPYSNRAPPAYKFGTLPHTNLLGSITGFSGWDFLYFPQSRQTNVPIIIVIRRYNTYWSATLSLNDLLISSLMIRLQPSHCAGSTSISVSLWQRDTCLCMCYLDSVICLCSVETGYSNSVWVCGFVYDIIEISDHVASNGRMAGEEWNGRDWSWYIRGTASTFT